jgi:23S rRNA (guanosine2251-2'-O)-methyltransferase
MTIVLDNIRSAFNVGSIMRSCDATNSKLITLGYTPKPLGETKLLIKKTAIRAEDVVEWEHFDHPQEVFEAYPNKIHIGVELFQDALSVYDFMEKWPSLCIDDKASLDDVFIWLGNEIHGISESIKPQFNYTVYLPMDGIKESLNVSNTATTILYLLKMLETKKITKKV